jgi:hypothetical protein
MEEFEKLVAESFQSDLLPAEGPSGAAEPAAEGLAAPGTESPAEPEAKAEDTSETAEYEAATDEHVGTHASKASD